MTTGLLTLDDDALIERIAALAARSRETTADLIAHLVELERRGLHLACGFNSLFGYCRRVLHCSEAAAYDRMRAAHAARRFPVVLAMLADGALHLTAVRLLWPHLKDEDHLALLGGAIHKSGREVRALVARWFPQPDVPASVRRVSVAVATRPSRPEPPPVPRASAPADPSAPTPPPASPTAAPAPVPRDPVRPLAASRYEFRFTGDDETAALLEQARELLSHSNASVARIFKRGLQLVVAEARRARFAETDRPRASRGVEPGSRAIPAGVQRAVWDRDDGQCSFLGRDAWRCGERRFLEFHHLTPWIVGGAPSVENITLRCRAHNQYDAKTYFAPIRRGMQLPSHP